MVTPPKKWQKELEKQIRWRTNFRSEKPMSIKEAREIMDYHYKQMLKKKGNE